MVPAKDMAALPKWAANWFEMTLRRGPDRFETPRAPQLGEPTNVHRGVEKTMQRFTGRRARKCVVHNSHAGPAVAQATPPPLNVLHAHCGWRFGFMEAGGNWLYERNPNRNGNG